MPARDVVVNFDLGERFPRPRSQQRGSLHPRARRVAVLVWVREGVAPPAEGVQGRHPMRRLLAAVVFESELLFRR